MSSETATLALDHEKLQKELFDLAAIFNQAVNIHIFTKELGQHFITFLDIDKKYSLSHPNLMVEKVTTDIIAQTPNERKSSVTTVLNSIKNFSGIDAETGVNLQDLFLRVCSLIKIETDGSGLLIDNLAHNIETQGGCIPGIVARLIHLYTRFVGLALDQYQDALFDYIPEASNTGSIALPGPTIIFSANANIESASTSLQQEVSSSSQSKEERLSPTETSSPK